MPKTCKTKCDSQCETKCATPCDKPCASKEGTECPCDETPPPSNEATPQEFLFGMSDTIRDHLAFMYVITMSAMFQANCTEWRDRIFNFFAEAMQNHMKMINEIPDQPSQFYDMAMHRATKYLNNIVDAYRTMEGTVPPPIREMYEADKKAQQERQIEEALAKAHEIIAEQNRKMGIDPNDPNTKTTTNVVINTNPSMKELKEQAIQYGIPLGPPGKQRIITPEEYAKQQQSCLTASSSVTTTVGPVSSTISTPASTAAPTPVKRGRPKKATATTKTTDA